jgi:hypothetical protein
MQKSKKQRSIKMLVIYLITALLFLTSVELHIHTQEMAATVGHGSAVDISSIADSLKPEGSDDEISVSPDSALQVKQIIVSLLAVFLLFAVMVAVFCETFICRWRECHSLLPAVPFYGTPPLRAPPQ